MPATLSAFARARSSTRMCSQSTSGAGVDIALPPVAREPSSGRLADVPRSFSRVRKSVARRRTTGTRRHVPAGPPSRGRHHRVGRRLVAAVAGGARWSPASGSSRRRAASAGTSRRAPSRPRQPAAAARSADAPQKPARQEGGTQEAGASAASSRFQPTPGHPVDKGDGIKIGTFLGNSVAALLRHRPGTRAAPRHLEGRDRLGQDLGHRVVEGPVTWAGTGWTGQPTLVRDKGKLYLLIGGFDHGLRKIDAATGKTIWRYEFPDVIKGTNTVWIDKNSPDGRRAGSRWSVVLGGARTSNLYSSLDAVTPVRCVSFETGKEIWRLPVPRTAVVLARRRRFGALLPRQSVPGGGVGQPVRPRPQPHLAARRVPAAARARARRFSTRRATRRRTVAIWCSRVHPASSARRCTSRRDRGTSTG